jgi:septum formation protein
MLILASASPRRAELLRARGVAFEVVVSGADEDAPGARDPDRLAEELACRKARAVAARVGRGTVLGADTVVAVGDVLLAKPEDAADARRMLGLLSGTTHRVVTGYCAIDARSGLSESGRVTTRVTMRALSDAEIADYVASGESEGKAGAYAIQETADRFVTRLDGPFDNVVGLPVDAALAAVEAVRRRAAKSVAP